jgi:hypothetical protein
MPKNNGKDMPQTEQQRYPVEGDLGYTTAIPRCEEYDLEKVSSRTRFGSWGDECTFKVPKPGNEPYVKGSDK